MLHCFAWRMAASSCQTVEKAPSFPRSLLQPLPHVVRRTPWLQSSGVRQTPRLLLQMMSFSVLLLLNSFLGFCVASSLSSSMLLEVSQMLQLLLLPLRVSATTSGPTPATAGLGNASAPAPERLLGFLCGFLSELRCASRGQLDASALASTVGWLDASAPVHAFGRLDATAAAPASVGQPDASGRMEDVQTPTLVSKAFQGLKERLIIILVTESSDEGFEDEPPPDPVPEQFKEKPVLVLVSASEGFPGAVFVKIKDYQPVGRRLHPFCQSPPLHHLLPRSPRLC
ncbi:hypothetical protein ATANTOWER_003879 [Ataeniobius toweri]|uniref:Uncharacterized protein n=1 Tax=Ataeniobius toweri TaxID=208326 RepID=A0ABU7B4U6_9TELE|nr:hypothetical protein [Ataeniobius toweri]